MAFQAIEKNLSAVERKLGKANKIAGKGDSISYKDAIKLGTKSNSIVSTLKKGIRDFGDFNPSESEAQTLLKQMESIVQLTESQLDLLVKDKPHFDKLKVGGLVKKNVAKTEAVSKELSELMISKSPSSIKASADTLETRRGVAFKKATAAFEGATGGENEKIEEDDSD